MDWRTAAVPLDGSPATASDWHMHLICLTLSSFVLKSSWWMFNLTTNYNVKLRWISSTLSCAYNLRCLSVFLSFVLLPILCNPAIGWWFWFFRVVKQIATLASSQKNVNICEQSVVKLLWWFTETVKGKLIHLVLEDEMWDSLPCSYWWWHILFQFFKKEL